MATVKLLLNKSRIMKDGTFPLVFQIIHQRVKKLIYSGCKLSYKQFDSAKAKIVRHADFPLTNYNIRKMNRENETMRKKILAVIHVFESRGIPYSASQVVGQFALEQEAKKDVFLFSYFDERIRFKQQLGKVGIMAAYQSTRASIEQYWGRVDLRLSEVTVAFVKSYQEHLQLNKVSANSIAYYMRNFRTIYKYALEKSGHDRPLEDPFKDIGTQPCKTIKRALKRETLVEMANADFRKRPTLDMARDIFLFSFYTRGMAIVDIIYLTNQDISDGVLTYSRRKTGQALSILVTDPMKELIAKYSNGSEYVFPFMSDDTPEKMYNKYRWTMRRINNGLKALSKELDVDYNLTTYVARHTWATLAKMSGISISIISEGLGHTSEKTTEIYLKQFDRSVLDQANEIVTKLK